MLSTGNKKEQNWGEEKWTAFKQGETNIPKVNRVKLKYVCCTMCPCSGRMSYLTSIDKANTSSFPPLASYEQNKLTWNMTQFYHLALKYCLQITRQKIFSGKDRIFILFQHSLWPMWKKCLLSFYQRKATWHQKLHWLLQRKSQTLQNSAQEIQMCSFKQLFISLRKNSTYVSSSVSKYAALIISKMIFFNFQVFKMNHNFNHLDLATNISGVWSFLSSYSRKTAKKPHILWKNTSMTSSTCLKVLGKSPQSIITYISWSELQHT